MADGRQWVDGVVVAWSAEEGWGRLASPHLDGEVFAHFSMITGRDGYRELSPGEAVRFTWSSPGQDGCAHRADEVRSVPEAR